MSELLYEIRVFDLEDFLMKGVLCFMLFAGSCHMKLRDFKRLMRPVGVLAVLATNVILLSVFAILCNLLARSGSLFFSTFLIGPLPDNYDRKSFVKLLTWGGLRGGLSIALAMSTNSMLPDEIYHIVLGCTYAIVFFTTVVQGLTMRKVYERIQNRN